MPGSSPAGITNYGDHSLTEEHRIVAPACAGSNPAGSPNYEHVSKWPKEAGCNPVVRWFESSRALQHGKIAQQVERSVEARKAAGSMPALTTIQIIKLRVEFTRVDRCDIFIHGKKPGSRQPTKHQQKQKEEKKQMMYLRFAPKSINTESKPQGIDLMGRCFVCKNETSIRSVRHVS